LIVSAIFHYYEGENENGRPENILQKGIENSDNRNALFAVKELLERKYSKPLLHDCRKTNWRQSSVHASSSTGEYVPHRGRTRDSGKVHYIGGNPG
jgi:hypothetical protein